MTQISPAQPTFFRFLNKSVRTVEIDGVQYMARRDVLQALGYENTNNFTSYPSKEAQFATGSGLQTLKVVTAKEVIKMMAAARMPGMQAVREQMYTSILEAGHILQALQDFEVPEDVVDMFVYVVRNTKSGHLKIGISRDPELRLKQIQGNTTDTLELVAYKKAVNGFKDEKAEHLANAKHHIRGEWFNENASLTESTT